VSLWASDYVNKVMQETDLHLYYLPSVVAESASLCTFDDETAYLI
jgi:hypothetical protein